MKQDKFLKKICNIVAKELHHQLVVVCLCMNIDIKQLLMDCEKDFDKFWALINKYYNDYSK